ncbi:MAG: DNA recombination protein RmuC [Cytophagales bacterium]|nr:DNA recombination protein RmuC [Cytophagales bacterium]
MGTGVGYLLFRVINVNDVPQSDELKIQLKLEIERSTKLASDLQLINDEIREEREKTIHFANENAGLKANNSNLEQHLTEHKVEVTQIQEKFSAEFKNLANKIFEEKSKKFTEQNKSNLDVLLNPLKDKIEKFEKKVDDSSKENIKWNSALSQQVNDLKQLNQQITKEAENLTKAIKGDSKSQGNWGEIQLEAILSHAGLENGIHYEKEKNFKSDEGFNQRPDYIIKLPDNKYLVIDSKVSLTAYTNFFNAESKEDRQQHMKLHLDSVHTHIKQLSDRNYQNLYEINQPDYVLLFVANEPALTAALKEDQSLFEKAMDKNIVLVSTSTLLATLRTISYIWKQDLQNKNALEIARQAGSLYDKFTNFTTDLIKVGKSIESTKNVYQEAAKKLYDGSDNLIRKTERLKELGAKTSKQQDQRLLDEAGATPSTGSKKSVDTSKSQLLENSATGI